MLTMLNILLCALYDIELAEVSHFSGAATSSEMNALHCAGRIFMPYIARLCITSQRNVMF